MSVCSHLCFNWINSLLITFSSAVTQTLQVLCSYYSNGNCVFSLCTCTFEFYQSTNWVISATAAEDDGITPKKTFFVKIEMSNHQWCGHHKHSTSHENFRESPSCWQQLPDVPVKYIQDPRNLFPLFLTLITKNSLWIKQMKQFLNHVLY